MMRFPLDPTRQNLWVKNIGRKNCEPKQYSAVCEVHFAEGMQENRREDGTKKLKLRAVPTIFPVFEKQLPGTAAESLDEPTTKTLKNNESNNKNSKQNTIDELFEIENNSRELCSDNLELNEQVDNGTHLLSSTNNTSDNDIINISDDITNIATTSLTSTPHNSTAVTLKSALQEIQLLQQKLEVKNVEVQEAQKKNWRIATKLFKNQRNRKKLS